METRLRALEEQVTQLSERVGHLEERLAALPPLPPAWPEGEPHLPVPSTGAEMSRWVTLLGRSCVVLGGAFLIRALTEGGTLSGGVGVALGILFAATSVFFAHRAGASGRTLSAGFHGVTAAAIAYPLVLEATARLGAMSSWVAAVTLVGFTGLLLMVAWRDRVGWLAWIGVLSCLLTTVALLRVTPARMELVAVLLVLAATTFWLGDRPRWGGLRWLPAVVLDLVVLRAVLTPTPPLLVYSLALAGLSLALVLSRTAALERPVEAFEVFQILSGLGIGLAGALRASAQAGRGSGAVAVAVLAVSLLAAFFAGWVVPRRGKRDLDFLFYGTLSLGLLSIGVGLLTSPNVRGVLWSILALLTALLGRRRHPLTLWSLAALLAVGAALSTGLIREVGRALVGGETIQLAMSPASIVLGLVVLTYLVTVPPLPSLADLPDRSATRLPAAALLLLASAGLATLVLQACRPFTADPARMATARTLVAVALALALVLMRRRMANPELTWISNLALALGGVELVVRGLPSGRPLSLLVSFVLYGAALLLIPRLAPAARTNPSGGASSASVGTRS
jgi:hypothetical protein